MRREPTGKVILRGRIWHLVIYHGHPLPHRESSYSTDKVDAEKLLAKRLAEMRAGVFKPNAESCPYAKLIAGLLADYKANKRRTLKQISGSPLKHLKKFFGRCYASEITRSRVRDYQVHRQGQGAANGTINRECALLKRSLTLAEDVIGPTIRMPMLKEDNAREGFVTPEQFTAIRAMLPKWPINDLVAFVYLAAWRITEGETLRWPFIDLSARTAHLAIARSKNGKARVLPLVGELWDIIQRADQRRVPGCDFVFHRYGKPVKDFRWVWQKAREMAGVTTPSGHVLVHDLRRSGVRNMRRAGVSESVAMSISGHRTASVFRRYDIVDETDQREALERTQRHNDNTIAQSTISAIQISQ